MAVPAGGRADGRDRRGPGVRLVRRRPGNGDHGRRLRCGVGVEVGAARRRAGPRPGGTVPAAGNKPRLRPAGGGEDVVQARPDLRHHRSHPRWDHGSRLPRRSRPIRRCSHRPARRQVAEVAAHPAVRAERGDVPPRSSTPPRATKAVGGALGARDRLGGDREPSTRAGSHHAALPRPAPGQPASLLGGLHRDHTAPIRRASRHPQ